jgi:fluoroquinolone resistance protein
MGDLDEDSYDGAALEGLDLSGANLRDKEFYRCAFRSCDFTEADLSGSAFDQCSFKGCNFSNPVIKRAKLIAAEFEECKLVGINFYNCDQLLFESSFSDTRLQNCNFSELKMKKARFLACRIDECAFENSFLVEARFDDSVFRGTLFHACDLRRASFLEAKGYAIDPRGNNVDKAVFSVPDVLSLVESFGIVIKNRE